MRAAAVTAVLAMVCGLAALGPGRAAADTPSGSSVQITSPVNGAGVDGDKSGYVIVSAVGQVDQSQNDGVLQMQLTVDPATNRHTIWPTGSGCAGMATCNQTYRWILSEEKGQQHTLQETLLTRSGQTLLSPIVTVHLFGPTSIELSPPGPAEAGSMYPIMGIITDANNGLPAGGASVTVRFTPKYGAASSKTMTTSSGGGFQVDVRATSNGTASVVVNSSQRWGPSAASISISSIQPNVLCAAAHSSVRHGTADAITCKAAGLPAGVVATLSYLSGKKHVFYSHSKSTSSKITFSFKMKKPGKYTLYVDVPANKIFAASGGLAKVTVK